MVDVDAKNIRDHMMFYLQSLILSLKDEAYTTENIIHVENKEEVKDEAGVFLFL